VNDAVFGTLKFPNGPQGSYAEYIVVDTADAKAIAKKPNHLSFVEAASVGLTSLTALEGVVMKRGLPLQHTGDDSTRPKVLVIGASGGVGMYGVEIAKAVGAEVVGICSNKNVDLVKKFGADRVVDYNDKKAMDDLASNEVDSFDVVFDLVGGDDYYNKFMPLVKVKTGIFTTAVGPTEHNGSQKLGLLDYFSFGGTLLYRQLFASRRYSMILGLPQDKFASIIAPWLEQKKLGTYVLEENIFDLKDGNKAHEKIESQRTVGKIVLRVVPDA
jgi:NADPH:quinone reductase-like Zn-dependent oxidoreductase